MQQNLVVMLPRRTRRPATKMLIAKNSVEPAVFVLFFYNFSTIPDAVDADSRAFRSPDPFAPALRESVRGQSRGRSRRCCSPFESAIPGWTASAIRFPAATLVIDTRPQSAAIDPADSAAIARP